MVEKMSHFIFTRFILLVMTLVDGNCSLDPLHNELAATVKITNFGCGKVSFPHKLESGQQKTTWALNVLTVQVLDVSF